MTETKSPEINQEAKDIMKQLEEGSYHVDNLIVKAPTWGDGDLTIAHNPVHRFKSNWGGLSLSPATLEKLVDLSSLVNSLNKVESGVSSANYVATYQINDGETDDLLASQVSF